MMRLAETTLTDTNMCQPALSPDPYTSVILAGNGN